MAKVGARRERHQRRYRLLLCHLYGVTPEQLGFAAPQPAPPRRDPESLVRMLDSAAALLDQFGAALAPQPQAADAVQRVAATPETHTPTPLVSSGPAHHRAMLGAVYLGTGNHPAACTALGLALAGIPATTDHRARILALTDLALTELRSDNPSAACRHATTAATLLGRLPFAAAGLRAVQAFRATAAAPLGTRALRLLDEHLSHLAARVTDPTGSATRWGQCSTSPVLLGMNASWRLPAHMRFCRPGPLPSSHSTRRRMTEGTRP
jgi:hypothetical protein